MRIEVDTVKGFQDYLMPLSAKRESIRKIAEETYKLYGFVPIETPIVEYDELMRSDVLADESEDEAVSDRFRLKDRAGRNLGLRYEFTFQLARIFKMYPNIKLPFKRYQIGPVFRDEPIRTGRTRQFTQCDADIIGDSSVHADAECIALAKDIFKKLGIKTEVHVNNRKLIDSIIASCEISSRKQVLREIDKMDKVGEDAVKLNLKKYADSTQIITLFKLLEKDLDFFVENKFDGAEELKELEKECKSFGFQVKIVPTLVRGFGYYTGNIFEFMTSAKYALAAGGRYDKLIGKYSGRDVSAVGVSFSLEAIEGLCPEATDKLKITPQAKAIIVSIGQDKNVIKLAKKMREKEISCITHFDKTGKALEYANVNEIEYAIFVGEKEIQKKKYTARNLGTGQEKSVTETQLIKLLSK